MRQFVSRLIAQVVIYSFFYLLVAYLGTTEQELRTVFRRVELKKWMWPMGSVKYLPSSGWHCASSSDSTRADLSVLQLNKW